MGGGRRSGMRVKARRINRLRACEGEGPVAGWRLGPAEAGRFGACGLPTVCQANVGSIRFGGVGAESLRPAVVVEEARFARVGHAGSATAVNPLRVFSAALRVFGVTARGRPVYFGGLRASQEAGPSISVAVRRTPCPAVGARPSCSMSLARCFAMGPARRAPRATAALGAGGSPSWALPGRYTPRRRGRSRATAQGAPRRIAPPSAPGTPTPAWQRWSLPDARTVVAASATSA